MLIIESILINLIDLIVHSAVSRVRCTGPCMRSGHIMVAKSQFRGLIQNDFVQNCDEYSTSFLFLAFYHWILILKFPHLWFISSVFFFFIIPQPFALEKRRKKTIFLNLQLCSFYVCNWVRVLSWIAGL